MQSLIWDVRDEVKEVKEFVSPWQICSRIAEQRQGSAVPKWVRLLGGTISD